MKKISVGMIISLISIILTVIATVLYKVNITDSGYFQNATVTNLIPLSIAGIATLVAAIAISMATGKSKATEIIVGLLQIVTPAILVVCALWLVAGRAEGLGYIYFSNADVAKEVGTAENLASASTAIKSIVLYGVSAVVAIIGAFFGIRPATKK